MNVIAHGIDLVQTARIVQLHRRHGQRFLDRIFTPAEQTYCMGRKRRFEHLAGRFAAKEAVLKVLGTGWRNGIAWTDIEVTNDASGEPSVHLAGQCARIAARRGLATILISISHIDTHGMASAIGVGEGWPGNGLNHEGHEEREQRLS